MLNDSECFDNTTVFDMEELHKELYFGSLDVSLLMYDSNQSFYNEDPYQEEVNFINAFTCDLQLGDASIIYNSRLSCSYMESRAGDNLNDNSQIFD